jgi:hypothetical protein
MKFATNYEAYIISNIDYDNTIKEKLTTKFLCLQIVLT